MSSWNQYSEEYRAAHPEYFVRSDAPSKSEKPYVSKRYAGVGGVTYEIREHGTNEKGRTRWGTWRRDPDGSLTPEPSVGVSVVRSVAERKLALFAKRLGYAEVGR